LDRQPAPPIVAEQYAIGINHPPAAARILPTQFLHLGHELLRMQFSGGPHGAEVLVPLQEVRHLLVHRTSSNVIL